MTEKELIKKQYEDNVLIIDDFKRFRDFLNNNDLNKPETILTLTCAVGVQMCKKTNANSLKLSSEIVGQNKNDFLSADVEITIKNIKYKDKK